MARRLSSIGASVVVISLSGVAIAFGCQLTRYEVATFDRTEPPAQVAAAYSDFVGLRARARRALAGEASLAAASAPEIEDVIAAEPTNGRYWLALAENWQDSGGAPEKVLEALRISEVVEPREAATMIERSAFILSLWDTLPSSEQRLAIAELAELGPRMSPQDRKRIATILAAKPEPVRAEIRSALLEKTGGERDALAGLGL